MTGRDKNCSLDEIRRGKVFALLAYMSILFLIPLFAQRGNNFVLFHVKQGLVLFIIECAVCVIRFLPVIGEVIFVFGMVICGILSLVGIIKACMNELWEMPVVFDFAEKFDW